MRSRITKTPRCSVAARFNPIKKRRTRKKEKERDHHGIRLPLTRFPLPRKGMVIESTRPPHAQSVSGLCRFWSGSVVVPNYRIRTRQAFQCFRRRILWSRDTLHVLSRYLRVATRKFPSTRGPRRLLADIFR